MSTAILIVGVASAGLVCAAPQQDANPHACCLAAEWSHTGLVPATAEPAAPGRCQVPLERLSCCIGAEWKLGTAAVADGQRPARVPAAVQSDERFCCLASEWRLP